MRYVILVLVLLVIVLFPKKKCDIEVEVGPIHQQQGSIELAIFDKPKVFLQKNKSLKKYSKSVQGSSIKFMLRKLTKGHYAISLYQDLNSDQKCNLNFVGIPLEPFGFSNNYKPFLKRPSFKDCQFNLQKDTSIHINLIGQLP